MLATRSAWPAGAFSGLVRLVGDFATIGKELLESSCSLSHRSTSCKESPEPYS
jgi:hypothetical protein